MQIQKLCTMMSSGGTGHTKIVNLSPKLELRFPFVMLYTNLVSSPGEVQNNNVYHEQSG